MDHNKLIDFEEVRDGIDNESLVMIDVRNRHELVKSGPNGGCIPGTKNVPCKLYRVHHMSTTNPESTNPHVLTKNKFRIRFSSKHVVSTFAKFCLSLIILQFTYCVVRQ